jgi:hypothetical protein
VETSGSVGQVGPSPAAPIDCPSDGAGFEELLRRAFAEPVERLGGRPDRTEDLGGMFGPGWVLGGWTVPEVVDDVCQLRHGTTPVGWASRLPQGPWGEGGWIALRYRSGGRIGEVITDGPTLPRFHRTVTEALTALHDHAAARP